MTNDLSDVEKYLKNSSSRHHYIPKFLLSAFANSEGLLYVYDKRKDEIIKQPRAPKSIFFEYERNTITVSPTKKTSILEDVHYKNIDDKTSRIIKIYQANPLEVLDFGLEDTAVFLFFLVTLFWRIPFTDDAAEDLMERSMITSELLDPETVRKGPMYQKLSRARLFEHHVAEMKAFGAKGKKWLNIHQMNIPTYVIGDNPILFKIQPNSFRTFNDTDILIALSSTRMYSSTRERFNNFPHRNAYQYNAAIIHQSLYYVACGDLTALTQSVQFYRKLRQTGLLDTLERQVFDTTY